MYEILVLGGRGGGGGGGQYEDDRLVGCDAT